MLYAIRRSRGESRGIDNYKGEHVEQGALAAKGR